MSCCWISLICTWYISTGLSHQWYMDGYSITKFVPLFLQIDLITFIMLMIKVPNPITFSHAHVTSGTGWQECIKSCCSNSGILCGEMWIVEGLGGPTLVVLLDATPVVYFLSWFHSRPAGFLGIHSVILASPTSWSLHCIFSLFSLSYTFPLRGFLCSLLRIPLKSEWKPLWLHNSCICMLLKAESHA